MEGDRITLTGICCFFEGGSTSSFCMYLSVVWDSLDSVFDPVLSVLQASSDNLVNASVTADSTFVLCGNGDQIMETLSEWKRKQNIDTKQNIYTFSFVLFTL